MPRKTTNAQPPKSVKPRAGRRKKPKLPPGPSSPPESTDAPPPLTPEKSPSPRRWPAVILFIAAVMLMTVGGASVAGWRYLRRWAAMPYGAASKIVEFKITPGTSFMDTSAQLATAGLVSDENLFRVLAVLGRKYNKIQAGVYRIKLPVTPDELIARLQKGSFQGKITIPEGWTARQMDDYLFDRNWISERGMWLRAVAEPVGPELLGEPLEHGAEGFCFPDTYMLDEGTPVEHIRSRMLARFAEVWRELNPTERDPRSAGLTLNEIVVLASIVERETRKPEELPRIASVFLNRLKIRMKLQSCATVHYALGEVWTRKLTYDDLKVESAFNTYKHSGLPPSAIGNPGRGALEAVLRPAPTDDLYFVHRGDGTHEFTQTHRDHQKAAAKFRRSDPNAALVQDR